MPTAAEKPRPMANDHHGSEMGKPETPVDAAADARCRARCRAGRRATSGTRPPSGTETGSRARRAPSALRTPISRVRSVTEIDMIAITPMPPTISAIDEITTSARNVAWLIWSHSFRTASCVDEVEVVRLVEPQAVADAHDRARRRRIASLARHAFARQHARSGSAGSSPLRRRRAIGAAGRTCADRSCTG